MLLFEVNDTYMPLKIFTLTSQCNVDPRGSHFYIVKLGFSGVYSISLFSAFLVFFLFVCLFFIEFCLKCNLFKPYKHVFLWQYKPDFHIFSFNTPTFVTAPKARVQRFAMRLLQDVVNNSKQ